jgi:hypothetical protein
MPHYCYALPYLKFRDGYIYCITLYALCRAFFCFTSLITSAWSALPQFAWHLIVERHQERHGLLSDVLVLLVVDKFEQ